MAVNFTLPKHAFTDAAGRTWRLVLNYGLAKQINEGVGVDLANAHNGQALKALGTNDELLIATLFALVEDQAQEAGVTPEQFARAFNGEVFEAAGDAISEMIRVFTRPAMRPVIEAMLSKGAEGRTAAIEMATAKLTGPAATAAIQRQIQKLDRQMDEALSTDTSSLTSSPPSPA